MLQTSMSLSPSSTSFIVFLSSQYSQYYWMNETHFLIFVVIYHLTPSKKNNNIKFHLSIASKRLLFCPRSHLIGARFLSLVRSTFASKWFRTFRNVAKLPLLPSSIPSARNSFAKNFTRLETSLLADQALYFTPPGDFQSHPIHL